MPTLSGHADHNLAHAPVGHTPVGQSYGTTGLRDQSPWIVAAAATPRRWHALWLVYVRLLTGALELLQKSQHILGNYNYMQQRP